MKEKKNILLLIPTFADEGGAQKMVYELGKLISEQYNVFECSFNAFAEKHVFKNNNKVLSLETGTSGNYLKKLFLYPRMAYRLHRLKQQYKIDITISNLWSADLVNGLSLGKDKKVSIGHINIVGNAQNKMLFRLRHFARMIYSRFDKVVAVSKPLMEELAEVFNLKPGNTATYINNFIDFPEYSLFYKVKDTTQKRLVTIGRLNPVKNQEVLLYVFNDVKQVHSSAQLIIIGDGPLKDYLIELSRKLGFKVSFEINEAADVIFTGFNPNPYPILFSSDLFVFPSKSEGLPLVLAEAMYAGLPMVVSDCPTGPHMILEGKGKFHAGRTDIEETAYGYLMPVPDMQTTSILEMWKSVIIEVLRDEAKRNSMAENGKKRAQCFSKNQIKESWFNLLNNL